MSLIDQVITAKKTAEEASASMGNEAQQAAMLIAQVQAILAGEQIEFKPTPETKSDPEPTP